MEVNAVLVLIRYFGYLNSDLDMFIDGVSNFLFPVLWYINLPLMVEGNLPVRVRYLVSLVLFAKFRNELSKQEVGLKVREKGVGCALILSVRLSVETDDVHVVMLR